MLADRLVVVAGNEDDALTVTRALEDLLHHRVLGRGPVDAAAHGPEVDDVADEEEVVGLVLAQEFEQAFGLARARAEMDVREKDRTNLRHRFTAPRASAALRPMNRYQGTRGAESSQQVL